MRYRAPALVAIGSVLAFLAGGIAQAQLIVTEKEVMRQARTEWLLLKKHTPRAGNERLQSYVECITNRLIDVLEPSFQDLSWEVVVFDDDAANAFALPGGKVGVFTGILRVADTPDALAAVIGHEIAHLTEDHIMQRAKRQSRTDALVILGGAATGMGDVIRAGAQIGLALPFDRRQESEADLVGLEYMAKAGFDPRASIYLWKNMADVNKGAPPEFLSTHPSNDRRLDDLVQSLTPALVHFNEARDSGRRPNCQL
ncbi:MAG TPA: M48 family metallopeptidase [Gammaproteobacteria bacterium]